MTALTAAVRLATTLDGTRGDAGETAKMLLDQLGGGSRS
jgi:hypothetical protein